MSAFFSKHFIIFKGRECKDFSGIHATAHQGIYSEYVNPTVCCPKHCDGNCNDCLLTDVNENEVIVPKSCDAAKGNMCSQRGFECCVTNIPNGYTLVGNALKKGLHTDTKYCTNDTVAPCRLGIYGLRFITREF